MLLLYPMSLEWASQGQELILHVNQAAKPCSLRVVRTEKQSNLCCFCPIVVSIKCQINTSIKYATEKKNTIMHPSLSTQHCWGGGGRTQWILSSCMKAPHLCLINFVKNAKCVSNHRRWRCDIWTAIVHKRLPQRSWIRSKDYTHRLMQFALVCVTARIWDQPGLLTFVDSKFSQKTLFCFPHVY